MNWFIHSLKHCADFSGRANRREWWIFWLAASLPAVLLLPLAQLVPNAATESQRATFTGLLLLSAAFVLIWNLILFIPYLSVTVRRVHDIGLSGWWLLLVLVPIIGAIFFLVAILTRGNRGPNRFGNPPQPVETGKALPLGTVSEESGTSQPKQVPSIASSERPQPDLMSSNGGSAVSAKVVRLVPWMALVLCAAVLALLFFYQTLTAQKGGEYGYSVSPDGSVTIDLYAGRNEDVQIPDNIDGKPVLGIAKGFLLSSEGALAILFGAGDRKINSITLPNTLRTVGDHAFVRLREPAVTIVNIPDSLASIGEGAFQGTRLQNVEIPNSITSIGDDAFRDSKISGRITLPAKFDNLSDRQRIGLISSDIAAENLEKLIPGLKLRRSTTDRTYVVQSGDSLAGIARLFYRNSGMWQKIQKANPEKLKDPTKLTEGMVLVIPDAPNP